uniref:Uncharacterized protein n=1 Tax=Erwinia amylovora TaxID=552 RepID=I1VYS1_ERWAM|nr:hypothetical protein [Erwinia amylovora]
MIYVECNLNKKISYHSSEVYFLNRNYSALNHFGMLTGREES